MSTLEILGHAAIALLLGAVIGIERELADKPAGLRTHMLVAGAAALLVSLGDILLSFFTVNSSSTIQSDPIRIVEAVITGVSFLGAGTILRRRKAGEVEGLTTAASLLFVAVIGICVGLSEVMLAIGATMLALVTLSGVKLLEKWLKDTR
ncbi:MAG: MgtC/SapB family protein [Caldilineaceae bacterium]|nr:MgtC/SapB family protein [Caldilineaceae bacterium]